MEEPGAEGRGTGIRLAVVCAIGIGTFVLGHFAAKPGMDYVLDDWSNLQDAFGSPRWIHPTRQLSILFNIAGFRLLGTHPGAFCLLSLLVHAACLLLLMLSAWRLTRSFAGTLACGLVMASLPTLYENIQWPTMIVGAAACCLLPCLGAVYAWICFVQTRKRGWLVAAAALYAVAFSAYEAGVFVPLAFPVLARGLTRREWARVAGVFALFTAPVLAWRFTGAFGLANFGLAAQFVPATDPATLAWNAKQGLSWLLGPAAVQAWKRGFDGLSLVQPMLVAVSGLALAAGLFVASVLAVRQYNNWNVRPGLGRVAVFGLLLCAAGLLPVVPAYACSRLMYVPAAGLALALAGVVARFNPRWTLPPVAMLAALGMAGNQGTSAQWSEAGVFCRAMYNQLNDPAVVAQWSKAEVIFFDTRGLPRNVPEDAVPACGNAELLRGFIMETMIPYHLSDGRPAPLTLLDFECGAKVEGSVLRWHVRYRPDESRETPISRVYIVECRDFWRPM